MGNNIGAVKYIWKQPFKNTFNMYLYGSGILSSFNFLKELVRTRSVEEAIMLTIEWYIINLTPFPLDEMLTSDGVIQFIVSLTIAVIVGSVAAGIKWRKYV